MKAPILLLLLSAASAFAQPRIVPAQPGPVIISQPGGGGSSAGGNATNVTLQASVPGLIVTNGNGNWTLTGNSLNTTNVRAGGYVVSSNVNTIIPNSLWTNASTFLGYGGLQLPLAWYGQVFTGNANPRQGIEWWVAGWDGTPVLPSDSSTAPYAGVQSYFRWGGSVDDVSGDDLATMHIFSSGNIRLEPNFSKYYGQGYLSLGNEDGNPNVFVNYAHGSVYNHNGSDRTIVMTSIKPWKKGYSLPLEIRAIGSANSSEYFSRPGIWAWAGDTNAADKTLGEISFMSKIPTYDLYQPTVGEQNPAGFQVFRMKTNYVAFNRIGSLDSGNITNVNNLYMGGWGSGAVGTNRIVFDFDQLPSADSDNQQVKFYTGGGSGPHGFGLGTVGGTPYVYVMSDAQVAILKGGAPSIVRVKFDVANDTNYVTGGFGSSYFRGNAAGVSNAVDIIAGTGVTVSTNANGRTYTLNSAGGDVFWKTNSAVSGTGAYTNLFGASFTNVAAVGGALTAATVYANTNIAGVHSGGVFYGDGRITNQVSIVLSTNAISTGIWTPIVGKVSFVTSNYAVYMVTPLKTNLISDGN